MVFFLKTVLGHGGTLTTPADGIHTSLLICVHSLFAVWWTVWSMLVRLLMSKSEGFRLLWARWLYMVTWMAMREKSCSLYMRAWLQDFVVWVMFSSSSEQILLTWLLEIKWHIFHIKSLQGNSSRQLISGADKKKKIQYNSIMKNRNVHRHFSIYKSKNWHSCWEKVYKRYTVIKVKMKLRFFFFEI